MFGMTRGRKPRSGVDELTHRIIGCAIRVHEELGPALLESGYQAAMEIELRQQRIAFEAQRTIPAYYRGERLNVSYRCDLLVERQVVVELKAVERLEPLFTAQLLTYLRLTSCQVGLLINFHVPLLKQGIKRIVNNYIPPDPTTPVIRDEE
jgi:GxxExxY protein